MILTNPIYAQWKELDEQEQKIVKREVRGGIERYVIEYPDNYEVTPVEIMVLLKTREEPFFVHVKGQFQQQDKNDDGIKKLVEIALSTEMPQIEGNPIMFIPTHMELLFKSDDYLDIISELQKGKYDEGVFYLKGNKLE